MVTKAIEVLKEELKEIYIKEGVDALENKIGNSLPFQDYIDLGNEFLAEEKRVSYYLNNEGVSGTKFILRNLIKFWKI